MAKPTIGFIGLGIMGRPMTKNLIDAGYPLVVYDIVPSSMENAVAMGAKKGASPADVAAQSDVVITMLPDSPDVEKAALGENGVMEGIRRGSIYVDMSSIAPATAVRTAEAGKAKGVEVLDAPVSGGDVGAQKGTLSIMVGGSQEAFDRVKPIFDVMGKAVLCGGNGAGQVVKVCNQILVGIEIAGVAEALTLGAKAGVDPAKIVEVLSGGLARCGILENRGQRMVRGDYDPGFRCRLHYKDMRNAVAAGQTYDTPLLFSGLVHEMFKRMLVAGRGDYDHSGLITIMEDLADIKVRTAE